MLISHTQISATSFFAVILDWSEAMEPCPETKRILEYCKEALNEIRTEEPTGSLWVRRWASLMALLRTTCEVLRKDAPIYWRQYMKKPNAHIKSRDRSEWTPDIFGKFIWTDANLFLHQGKSTTGQSIMVFLQGAEVQTLIGDHKPKPTPPPPPPPPPPSITSYQMNTGPYKGRDPRAVADEAIAWLEEQILIAET
jgi:hypothetical protein